MKKLLIFIFSIFFGLIGFSSAYNFSFFNGDVRFISFSDYDFTVTFNVDPSLGLFVDSFGFVSPYLNSSSDLCFSLYDDSGNLINTGSLIYSGSLTLGSTVGYYYWPINNIIKSGFYLTSSKCPGKSRFSYYLSDNSNNNGSIFLNSFNGFSYISSINYQYIFYDINYSFSSVSSSSDITVYYNNGQTTSISCNGDNIITIDGLSTMSSISTFTPYFNINYTDQNNQVLTDSYSNSILYLSGGQYLKTYTGGSNNDWILNLVTSEDTVFTGYLPTFDVTGNITEIDTGNVFNNFAENSLTVLLSNIPNYIQYVIMFALLLFVLGIFRKLRK